MKDDVAAALDGYSSDTDAVFLQRFFKTAPGQYGAGDVFIGVRVPQIRQVAKEFADLPLAEMTKLVDSEVHEHRMTALIICANRFGKAKDESARRELYNFYMSALKRGKINNWDLVDVTCYRIVGEYLLDKPRDILYELACSESLWDRRVSILATPAFQKRHDGADTLALAEILLHDPEDLIQKAVGWMLREVGKYVDRQLLLDFLDRHAHEMPRTMLRYSLEHLPESQRQYYMGLATSSN